MPHRSLWLDEALSRRRARRSATRGRRARRRRDHGRRLRRALDRHPHQAAGAVVRRRRARAGHLRRRRERAQRRLRDLLVGQARQRSSQLCGAEGALEVARACEAAVDELGAFCERALDRRALSPRRAPLDGHLAGAAGSVGRRHGDLPRARRDAVRGVDARGDGAAQRLRSPHRRPLRALRRRSCSRRSWRAACAASRSSSACASTRARASRGSTAAPPRCCTRARGVLTADRVVIATNAWAVGLRELHTRLAVISSDIVATAPVPERLREIGWTQHECISDSRLQISYYRTTDDGRVVFGKGGWGIALHDRIGARFDRDEGRARAGRPQLPRDLPDARRRADREPTGAVRSTAPAPDCRSSATSAAAATSSTASASRATELRPPSWAAESSPRSRSGSPTSGAAADSWTASRDASRPDPVRFLGAHLVREGVVRKEEAEMEGRTPNRLAAKLASFAPAGMIPKKSE